MNLLSMKKWSDLLTAVRAHSLFRINVVQEQSKRLLAPPVLVARHILNYVPGILEKESIRICLAGADYADNSNGGDAYQILPLLLNKPGISISIDLIGPQCFAFEYKEEFCLKAPPPGVRTNLEAITLGKYLGKGMVPDVIVMNMPGFEEHYMDWFVDDNGVDMALSKGIPILGSSYADDEAEIDGMYARAFGYNLSRIEDNPFKLVRPGMSFTNWAGQTWRLSPGRGVFDAELLALSKMITQVYKDYVEEKTYGISAEVIPLRMDAILAKFKTRIGGITHIWIAPDMFYVPEEATIIDSDGFIHFDDVELDLSDIGSIKGGIYKDMAASAVIRRDYDVFNEDDGFDEDELLNEDMVISDFGRAVLASRAMSPFELGGNQ